MAFFRPNRSAMAPEGISKRKLAIWNTVSASPTSTSEKPRWIRKIIQMPSVSEKEPKISNRESRKICFFKCNPIKSFRILIKRKGSAHKKSAWHKPCAFRFGYNHRLKSMLSPSKNGRTNPMKQKTVPAGNIYHSHFPTHGDAPFDDVFSILT